MLCCSIFKINQRTWKLLRFLESNIWKVSTLGLDSIDTAIVRAERLALKRSAQISEFPPQFMLKYGD